MPVSTMEEPEIPTTREWRDRMRDARQRREWKQSDLARRLGVTQATVSAIETGDVRASSHVMAICRLLAIDVPVVTGSELQRRWVEAGQVLAARMPATFLRHLEMMEAMISDVQAEGR